MVCGLLARHSTGAYFFFNNRVIFSLANEGTAGSKQVQPRVSYMPDGGDTVSEMEGYDGCSHHRKTLVLLGHLVNGSVCALNRELHQIFNISAVNQMAKGFVQNFNGGLGRNFPCFGAAHTVSHSKDCASTVSQEGIFV
jgi:hypothetical protein